MNRMQIGSAFHHARKPGRVCWSLVLLLLLPTLSQISCSRPAPNEPAKHEAPVQPPEDSIREYIKIDAPLIVLAHATIIDGTGTPARTDQTLVIEHGVIKAVGKAQEIAISPDARILDMRGYTLIPGIVGMHDHLFYPVAGNGEFQTMKYSFPRLYLASGVTSIRTAGAADWAGDNAIKKGIDEGKIAGPKVHLTSAYLNGTTDASPDPRKAADFVRYWADQGATSLKAYTGLRNSELAAVIQEAHTRGLKVTGHLGAVGFHEGIAAGIDNLEHGLLVDTEFCSIKQPDKLPDWWECVAELTHFGPKDPRIQNLISDLVSHGVAVTSTLALFETVTDDGFPLEQRVLDAFCPEARGRFMDHRRKATSTTRERWRKLLDLEMRFERDFVKFGGHLMAGVDPTGWGGVIAGFGDQRNVELLVQAGFKPEEAVRIATLNGAEFLGEVDRVGSLKQGKQADIVVIRGNPSRNISDIKNVEIVFKDGVGYDSQKLIESVKGQVGKR